MFIASLFFSIQLHAQLAASFQQKAGAALQSQVSQIGKDCPGATTTLEQNGCMLAVSKKTDADFQTFFENLRALLSNSGDALSQLDASQQEWSNYAKKACDAVDSLTQKGTQKFSAAERCHVQLVRSRMQDLNVLYDTTLHL